MDTWFSSSNLYEVWWRFNREKGFMHFLDIIHATEIPFSWFRRMITDVTLHITLIIDIEECKAWMILMLGANSTIKWTTTKNWGERFFWKVWLLEIIITEFVIIIIGRNSAIWFSTAWTELPKEYRIIPRYYMSRDESLFVVAEMTKWFGCSEKERIVGWVESHRVGCLKMEDERCCLLSLNEKIITKDYINERCNSQDNFGRYCSHDFWSYERWYSTKSKITHNKHSYEVK